MLRDAESLARLISLENGKALKDARVDLPTGAGLESEGAREKQNTVVALVPVVSMGTSQLRRAVLTASLFSTNRSAFHC